MRGGEIREGCFPYQKIGTFRESQKSQWVGGLKVQSREKFHGFKFGEKKGFHCPFSGLRLYVYLCLIRTDYNICPTTFPIAHGVRSIFVFIL